ncbi:uncharacterized protein LOC135475478 [Liolophura sinensis]|uniref:uncharacterized protein LOC135475404 n=1 Tax=Liolophura sinensis TaxID=3198878 RepID=UPI003158CBE0
MSLKTVILIAVVTLGCHVLLTKAQTNCGVGSACDNCPEGYYGIVQINPLVQVKVCCKGCSSKYFSYRSTPTPACTCQYDRVINDASCWKGEQCDNCNSSYTGSVNGLPVCCSQCRAFGLILSPTSCSCNDGA